MDPKRIGVTTLTL